MTMNVSDFNEDGLNERITRSIDASLAAESAYHDLTDGITVEEAQFCLSAVLDQVIGFKVREHERSYAHDEAEVLREIYTRKLEGGLNSILLNLLTQSEISKGSTPTEAKEAARDEVRNLYKDYYAKRNAIGEPRA